MLYWKKFENNKIKLKKMSRTGAFHRIYKQKTHKEARTMNEDIKKTIPEELDQKELSMVTGGNSRLISAPLFDDDSTLVSLPLSDDATRPAPPATNTVMDGSTSVGVCDKCRQGMSKDKLYSHKGKKYCRVCLISFF